MSAWRRFLLALLLVALAGPATPAEETVAVPKAELQRLQVQLAVLSETVEKQQAILRRLAEVALACTAQFRAFKDES